MKIEGATKEGYQGSGDKSSRKVGNWEWSKLGMYPATMRTVVFLIYLHLENVHENNWNCSTIVYHTDVLWIM